MFIRFPLIFTSFFPRSRPQLSMDISSSPVNLFARLDASLFIAFLFTGELQALRKDECLSPFLFASSTRILISSPLLFLGIPSAPPPSMEASVPLTSSISPFFLDRISVPPPRLSVLLKRTLISSLPRKSSHPQINLCFSPFKRPMFPSVVSRRTPNSVCSSPSSIFSFPSSLIPEPTVLGYPSRFRAGEKSYLSFIGVGSRKIIAKEKRTRKGERDNLSTQNGPGSKNARRGNNRTTIVINEPR